MHNIQTAKRAISKAKRQDELDADIMKVKDSLRDARSFEATLALRKLQVKLEHEKRICK